MRSNNVSNHPQIEGATRWPLVRAQLLPFSPQTGPFATLFDWRTARNSQEIHWVRHCKTALFFPQPRLVSVSGMPDRVIEMTIVATEAGRAWGATLCLAKTHWVLISCRSEIEALKRGVMPRAQVTGASGVIGSDFARHVGRIGAFPMFAVSRRPRPTLPADHSSHRQVSTIFDGAWLEPPAVNWDQVQERRHRILTMRAHAADARGRLRPRPADRAARGGDRGTWPACAQRSSREPHPVHRLGPRHAADSGC